MNRQRKAYAVMTEDLTAYSFEDETIENCKRWCKNGYVIVERIPKVYGFSIRIVFHEFWKPISFGYSKNILWLHWHFNKEYRHITGDVVYRPE